MTRINQLIINNIGLFKKETFDFSIKENNPDIHILVGPNGSGKTTLLHALAAGFDYFENKHKEHLSNQFYKRVHFFEEHENEMAKSYSHTILTNKNTGKVIENIISFGCEKCGNFHQNYERTISDNNKMSVIGESYSVDPINKDLSNYKNAIISKDISNKTFKFAAFGYSGYRFISSSKIKISNNSDFNPLNLALEFIKKNDENSNISDWIVSRYSKAAIEETQGNKKLAIQYREALNCLINSLSNLTSNEYSFEIRTNPWKVVIKNFGNDVEFDVLPDGLRSILSWMGDLLMRLDNISWENKNIPVNYQDIILLLDEIEVHLHPKWQYLILPLIKDIFPNAQIFISTHSPFILNSIDQAKIYKLETNSGLAALDKIILSETGDSYNYIYENILETTNKFGSSTTKDLVRFIEIDKEIINKNYKHEDEFRKLIQKLVNEGEEVTTIISSRLFRLKNIIGKDYLNGENR